MLNESAIVSCGLGVEPLKLSVPVVLETTLTVNSLPLPLKLTNSVASVKVAVFIVLVLVFG